MEKERTQQSIEAFEPKEIQVVILSHKRHIEITTHEIVDNAIICIPESQKFQYSQTCPNAEILTHPDSVKGLAMKRKWIYEKFGDVFMLDDDIGEMKQMWDNEGDPKIDSATAYDLIQSSYNIARKIGCKLFGFSFYPMPLAYKPWNPIQLTGKINGSNFGIMESDKLYFTDRLTAVHDMWISLLNAYHYRRCYIDTRYCFVQKDTFKNIGGLSDSRTVETERKDTEMLRKKFGNAVRLKKNGGLRKQKSSEHERNLNIPF